VSTTHPEYCTHIIVPVTEHVHRHLAIYETSHEPIPIFLDFCQDDILNILLSKPPLSDSLLQLQARLNLGGFYVTLRIQGCPFCLCLCLPIPLTFLFCFMTLSSPPCTTCLTIEWPSSTSMRPTRFESKRYPFTRFSLPFRRKYDLYRTELTD
jgi:hypothetical protein